MNFLDIRKTSKKIQHKLFLQRKAVQQQIMPRAEEKKVLFISGCQRSGTTMVQRIFEKDINAKVYGEFSKLSYWDPGKIRLNPLYQVKRDIDKDAPSLIVLKPLVEAQQLPDLLAYFPGSRALWMYRHYKDVAPSNLKNFGADNGINDLRPIVEGDPLNWRSEKVSDEVRAEVRRYFSESMSPLDAAVLFWYVRNSLFFEQNLNEDPRILLCPYNDLVYQPDKKMQEIYAFLQRPYPGAQIVAEVTTSSVGKGKHVSLHPEIQALCEEMLHKLNLVYIQQSLSTMF